jgi:molecular chaperone GrpE
MNDNKKDNKKDDDLLKKVEELKKNEEEVREANSEDDHQKEEEKDMKIEELTNALSRCMADLQNMKRRTEEDRLKFAKYANAEMLKILIPIFDNLSRSVDHQPQELKDNEWAKGISHVYDDLLKTLDKIGVKKIKTVGQSFDHEFHEALMSGPGEKDIVLEEFEPGYTLQGETIKAAKVKVGDGS